MFLKLFSLTTLPALCILVGSARHAPAQTPGVRLSGSPASSGAAFNGGAAAGSGSAANSGAVSISGAVAQKPTTTPKSDAHAELYKQTLRGTVFIVCRLGPESYSTGSGWLLDADRKLVVTNHHVVAGAAEAGVYFPAYENGRRIDDREHYRKREPLAGEVLLSDPKRDLAVIRLTSLPEGATALELAPASPQPGQLLMSIGNAASVEALWSATTGSVRQVYRKKMKFRGGQVVDAVIVETQSPTNPGDSGGPVVDDQGRLVGVVSAGAKEAQLVTTFIDVSEVRNFAREVDGMVDPRTAEQLARRGDHYGARGNFTRALEDFAAALKLDPNSTAALAARGRARLEQGDEMAALADFNTALRIDSDCLAARLGRAEISKRRELDDQMVAELTEVIRIEPKTAAHYVERGRALGRKREFKPAVEDLDRAVAMEPANPDFRAARGEIHLAAGDADRAITDCVEVVREHPEHVKAYLTIGEANLRLKRDAPRAAEAFGTAIARDPTSAAAYFGRGDAYLQAEQYAQSMQDLEKALELQPKFAEAYSLRGDLHLVQGQYAEAVADYRRAVELEPSRAQFHCDLGVALNRSEDFAGATKSLQAAARLAPAMARAHFYLAVAAYSSGDEAGSKPEVERAKKLDPKRYGDADLKRRYTRRIGFANGTDKTLKVSVWYYTNVVGDEWKWLPAEPGKGTPIVHTIEPRGTLYPTLGKERLAVAKVRFTAEDTAGTFHSQRYADNELRIVPEGGYIDASVQTYTHTISAQKRESSAE
jgi:tetratricopeptide (TPR) repeat protein